MTTTLVDITRYRGRRGWPCWTRTPTRWRRRGEGDAATGRRPQEVATRGIFVNAVALVVIGTELLRQMEPGTVDLASDECSFSTGAVYDLSGGRATY